MKPKLIWPTMAEQIQTSAERRKFQRDREERAQQSLSASKSAKKQSPQVNAEHSKKTTSPDENCEPSAKVKERGGKTKQNPQTTLSTMPSTPKLKQKTLDTFLTFSPKNSAPTPSAAFRSGFTPPNKKCKLNSDEPSSSFNSQQQFISQYVLSNSPAVVFMPNIGKREEEKSEEERQKRAMILSKEEQKRKNKKFGMARKGSPTKMMAQKLQQQQHNQKKTQLKKLSSENGSPSSQCTSRPTSIFIQQSPLWKKKEEDAKKQSPSAIVVVEQNKIELELETERAELNRKRVLRLNRRLKNALVSLDRDAFARELKVATQRFTEQQITSMGNPFIRYLVARETEKQKMDASIRALTSVGERKARRREYNQQRAHYANAHFDHLFAQFQMGRYEDGMIPPDQQQLCELRPMFADQPALATHFGRTLAITQFFNAHFRFLHTKAKMSSRCTLPSAVNLLTGMASAKPHAGAERVLALLVHFLSEECKQKPKPKLDLRYSRNLRSRNIRETVRHEPEVLDLAKMLLVKAIPEEEDDERAKEKKQLDSSTTELRDALTELEQAEQFHHLSVVAQLALLEHFVARVHTMDTFHAYLEEHANEQQEAQQHKQALENQLAEMQRELCELKQRREELDDTALVTRGQTAECTRNQRELAHKQRAVDAMEEQLAAAERRNKTIKFANKCRTEPLGQDRLHRLYWFFAGSHDGVGLFVQQQACTIESCFQNEGKRVIKRENRKDESEEEETEAEFMDRFTEIVDGRPCAGHREERWWQVQTRAELAALLDCLSSRALREYGLKRQLLEHRDLIEASMRREEEMASAKREGEVEQENDDQVHILGEEARGAGETGGEDEEIGRKRKARKILTDEDEE